MWDIIEGIGVALDFVAGIHDVSRTPTRTGPRLAFCFGLIFVAIGGVWLAVTRLANPHPEPIAGKLLTTILQAAMIIIGVILIVQSFRIRLKSK